MNQTENHNRNCQRSP